MSDEYEASRGEAFSPEREFTQAEQGLVAELKRSGFPISSIENLLLPEIDGTGATQVLLDWFPRISNLRVREAIAIVLGQQPASAALQPLIALFRQVPPDAPGQAKVRWAIADSIARLADESVVPQLLELLRDPTYGQDRGPLIIAMGRFRRLSSQSVPLLIAILSDRSLANFAAVALGNLDDPTAVIPLQALQRESQGEGLKIVSNAIAKIIRSEARRAARRGR